MRRRPILLCLAALLALASQAQATWKPEYASNPPEVRAWYQNAELTEAAKIRFPFKKCCDHADVVKTKFNVNRTNNGDEWFWLDGEEWRRIHPTSFTGARPRRAASRRCSSIRERKGASFLVTAVSEAQPRTQPPE
jgi:hypothetical protein